MIKKDTNMKVKFKKKNVKEKIYQPFQKAGQNLVINIKMK